MKWVIGKQITKCLFVDTFNSANIIHGIRLYYNEIQYREGEEIVYHFLKMPLPLRYKYFSTLDCKENLSMIHYIREHENS